MISLWSGKNVLKHAVNTSITMNKPGTSDGGLGYYSAKTIVHGLGYRPVVRAFYDPIGNGTIFPTVGQFNGASAGLSTDSPINSRVPSLVPFSFFIDNLTATDVTFRTYSKSALAGTFTFYYKIYVDPTL